MISASRTFSELVFPLQGVNDSANLLYTLWQVSPQISVYVLLEVPPATFVLPASGVSAHQPV